MLHKPSSKSSALSEEDNKGITRSKLSAHGLSHYHSRVLTASLNPTGKLGNAYVYRLSDVITSTRRYLERPRLQRSTRQKLTDVLSQLVTLLGNVVAVPFVTSNQPEMDSAVRQLVRAMARTDTSLADLVSDAVEIEAKYSV